MSLTQRPFTPSYANSLSKYGAAIQMVYADVQDRNVINSSSFAYDPQSYPLKNSQQLNTDWSKFENHCFFMSAVAKVNATFYKIINTFPFDKPRQTLESFFESLSGFEKWMYDSVPKYTGALDFSNSWIVVKDVVGGDFPSLSDNSDGTHVINPKSTSMTIDMQMFVSSSAATPHVVCQKASSSEGFTVYVSGSRVGATFSNSSDNYWCDAPIAIGAYQHVCVVLDRDSAKNSLQLFVGEKKLSQSTHVGTFADMSIDKEPMIIGSGSSFYLNNLLTVPTQTFSGILDDFRIFHSVRTTSQQSSYSTRGVYPTDDLVFYMKFNEPASIFSDPLNTNNARVLDSSGNNLHSVVTNFSTSLRINSSTDLLNPLKNERLDFNPVLFPSYASNVSLLSNLLASGSAYDMHNPNLITRLIPPHYLKESMQQDGKTDDLGSLSPVDSVPFKVRSESTHMTAALLYAMASFYDELKVFIDSFSTLNWVDYDKDENAPDNFLTQLSESYGMYFPPLFNNSTLQQFIDGEDYDNAYSLNNTLKSVQSELTRRVLINMPAILRSKGTHRSIRTFLHALGIDTKGTVRLREYGGPTEKLLENCRENRFETVLMAKFPSTAYAVSDVLYSHRVEPGIPVVSNTVSDNLLTSGSWTIECACKLDSDDKQSLFRLCTGTSQENIIANVVSENGGLTAYVRPGTLSTSPILSMSINNSIVDNSLWNVSLSCDRSSSISGSYTLRVGKQENGSITSFYESIGLLKENATGGQDTLKNISSLNPSGSQIVLGNVSTVSSSLLFLNNDVNASYQSFSGYLANVRFWSKLITLDEWTEHVRDYKSSGVDDPTVNYNFISNSSGSFERLRMSVLERQTDITSDPSGSITFHDLSLNSRHMHGYGFTPSSQCYFGEMTNISVLSTKIDEVTTDNKVRVRGYQDPTNILNDPESLAAPVYDISYLRPSDDTRFSVDVSLTDALNRDITTMMSSFNAVSEAVGLSNLQFSSDYPGLENLADIYFNRLTDKLDFKKFFEFYRWFDDSISVFIEQLVQKKTNYRGMNLLVESHILERSKVKYFNEESYIDEANKHSLESVLLLQQIVGSINRF